MHRRSASPTRRPVTWRFDQSGHERPAQPGAPEAGSIRREGSRAVEYGPATKIIRNHGVNRTRVRAKMGSSDVLVGGLKAL